jgi:hypothetical protein
MTTKKLLLPPALAALVLSMAGPAGAAPLEREHYSGTDHFTDSGCGFEVTVDVTFEGVFMLKAPKNPGEPPRYFDNYETHETLTAEGSTRVLTIDHQGLYKDLQISLVEGTVYQFVSIEAGQPFVVRGDDGQVLMRDRGLLKTTFQVDTKGDTDLSNDEFIDGTFSVLADRGAHPGFYLDDEGFCSMLEDGFYGG